MKEKITDAKDNAGRSGYKSHVEWIDKMSANMAKRNVIKHKFIGKVSGDPIYARIDFGRWIADCECGGAEYVSPDEPVFFCMSCGNEDTKGDARPVVFPEENERKMIEAELVKRKVRRRRGLIDEPDKGELPRSWNPGETIDDLIMERERGL